VVVSADLFDPLSYNSFDDSVECLINAVNNESVNIRIFYLLSRHDVEMIMSHYVKVM